ncbi:hypothetical protein SNE40_000184 [Patella caerulea]|uniref:Protein phosphatase inhibitor 2 n=1 Tax=Patella caerulea TaxID=87958 RepID=A0AAN8KDX0_PATCE
MAASEEMRPKKGILKRSSSLDQRTDSSHSQSHKEMSWDEMNIIATHHPPDKDYGHMKIDEPPTPYSKNSDFEDEDVIEAEGERRGSVGKSCSLDPSSLTSRLSDHTEATVLCHPRLADDGEEDDEEEEETEEDQEERHKFELKRKLHYNEFQAVQLAKKLMAEEDDEDDEEDDSNVNMEEQSKNTPAESQNKEK